MLWWSRVLGWTVVLAAGWAGAWAQTPWPRAHAHNDYEHPRPLFDALEQGFCGVEADIWLVNGELLVAHNQADVKPGRTLEALYLVPLQKRVQAGGGRVFPGTNEFSLLIDIKADPEGTYAVLGPLLERYRGMLTRFTATNVTLGAVTVILSGARPIAQVQAQAERWCGIDGRLPDLLTNPSPFLMPWVSDSWRPTFPWFTDGRMLPADRARLVALVQQAHAQGRRIRFWGLQDQEFVWRELFDAGVDLINTDKLAELRKFMESRPK